MKFVKREYITCIIILSIIVLTACDQRYNTYNPIPEMPVNYTLNIVRDAPILMTQGGFISITEPNKSGQYIGYGGLLIFYGFELLLRLRFKLSARMQQRGTRYTLYGRDSGMP